jgi:hypothetical protein
MKVLKLGYEKYIERLQEYYATTQNEAKVHYENYIIDLKKKALKRIEYEKSMSKQKLDELEKDVAAKEVAAQALIDAKNDRIYAYRQEINDIKAGFAEQKRQEQQDNLSRDECSATLQAILAQVECDGIDLLISDLQTRAAHSKQLEIQQIESSIDALKSEHKARCEQYEQECNFLRSQFEAEVDRIHVEHRNTLQLRETEAYQRKECETSLNDILSAIEDKAWVDIRNDHQSVLLTMKAQMMDVALSGEGKASLLAREIEDYKLSLADQALQLEQKEREGREKYENIVKEYEDTIRVLQEEHGNRMAEMEHSQAEATTESLATLSLLKEQHKQALEAIKVQLVAPGTL